VLVLFSLGAAACAPAAATPATVEPSPQPVTAVPLPTEAVPPTATYESLVTMLRDAGHTIEEVGPTQNSMFAGDGRIIKLDDQEVQIFQYPTAADLEGETARIGSNGSQFTDSNGVVASIDWVDEPHFFSSGLIMAVYVGHNAATVEALAAILGQQFQGAGAASPAASIATGAPITPGVVTPGVVGVVNLSTLTQALTKQGATVTVLGGSRQGLFDAATYNLLVNGQPVTASEFASAAAAAAAASTVSPDGSAVGGSPIQPGGTPHFYRSGRLIVEFAGDDAGLLSLLSDLMGPQFAGG